MTVMSVTTGVVSNDSNVSHHWVSNDSNVSRHWVSNDSNVSHQLGCFQLQHKYHNAIIHLTTYKMKIIVDKTGVDKMMRKRS